MKLRKLTAFFTVLTMMFSFAIIPESVNAGSIGTGVADTDGFYDNDVYVHDSNRADLIFDVIGTSTTTNVSDIDQSKNDWSANWSQGDYLWLGVYVRNMTKATYTGGLTFNEIHTIPFAFIYDKDYIEYVKADYSDLQALNSEFASLNYQYSDIGEKHLEDFEDFMISFDEAYNNNPGYEPSPVFLNTTNGTTPWSEGRYFSEGYEGLNLYGITGSLANVSGSLLATSDDSLHLVSAFCFQMTGANPDKLKTIQGYGNTNYSVNLNTADAALWSHRSPNVKPEDYFSTYFNIEDKIVGEGLPTSDDTYTLTYEIPSAEYDATTKGYFGTAGSETNTNAVTGKAATDTIAVADTSIGLTLQPGYELEGIYDSYTPASGSIPASWGTKLNGSETVGAADKKVYVRIEPKKYDITFILRNEDGTTPSSSDAQFNGMTPSDQKTLSLPYGSTIPVTVAALNAIAANTITVAGGKDITGAYNSYTNATTNTPLSPATVPAAAKTVYLTIGDATPKITYTLTGTASWNDGTTDNYKTETVAYNGNAIKGTQDTSTPPVTTLFSSLITPPSGQAFLNWYTKDGSSDNDWGTVFTGTNITADQTVYARFATARTVTYDANGRYYGSTSTDTIKTETVADGGNPTLGDTSGTFANQLNIATGYEFVGWFDTNAATGGTEFTASSTVSGGNKTVYARYAQKKAKVTFDRFSGTIDSNPVTINYKTIDSTDPHYDDYDNKSDNTNYEEDILADTTDGIIKLTKEEAYRVAALLDIGSGYTFGGWSVDGGNTPITYPNGTTGNEYYEITTNTTLTPIITKKGSATIRFKANDADTAYDSGALSVYVDTKLEDNTPVIYVVGTGYHGAAASAPAGSTKIPVPTRNGYTFKGWFRTDDSSNKEYATTDTYSAGDVAVYEAQWDLDKAEVKFIDTKPNTDTNYVPDVTYKLFPGKALDHADTKAVDMAETPTPTTIVTVAPTYTDAEKEYSVTNAGVTTSYEFIDWYVVDETKYSDTDPGTGNKLTGLEYIQQKISTRTDITTAETASILKKFNKSTTTMTKDMKIYAVYAKDTRITFTDTRLDTASKFTDIVYIAVPNSPAKSLSDTADTKAYNVANAATNPRPVESAPPVLTDAQKKYTNSSKTYVFVDWYTVNETAADIKSDGSGTYTDVAGFIAATDTAAKITAAETAGSLTKFDASTKITENDITVYAVYKLNDDSKLVKPEPTASPDPIDPGAIFYEGTLTDSVIPYTREVTKTIPDKGSQTVFEYPVTSPAPIFNPDQAMHPMVVPNTVDKVAAEFTPNDENAKVVIYDSLWDDDSDPSTPDVPKPMTTTIKTGTTATYTFENYEIDEVDDNTPTKIYVDVTASDGVTKTTYEFDILRLADPRIVKGYGNSPVGMIMRDEWSGWDDTAKQTAIQKFKNSHSRNKYYPDGYVPAKGKDISNNLILVDNSRTWTTTAWTTYGRNVNYDLDEYAYFVFQGQVFKDPGTYFKDEYGFHHDIQPTFTLQSSKLGGYPKYSGYAPPLLYPQLTQTQLWDATLGAYKLTSKIIIPDQYTMSYTYSYTKMGDSTATNYTDSRNFLVLSKLGDVNLSVSPETNNLDGPVLFNKYSTMLRYNSMLAMRAGNVSAAPSRTGNEAMQPIDATYLIAHYGKVNFKYYEDLWPSLNP